MSIHEHIKSGVLRAGSVASSRQTVHVCVCRWVCVGEEGSRKLLEGSDVGYWVAEYAGARRSLAAHWLTRCRKARERETLRLHLKRSWPIAMLQSSCWLNCWHTAISPSLWVSADSQKSGLHGRKPDILLMTNYTHFFSKRKLDNWKRLLWKLEQLRFASTASRSRQLQNIRDITSFERHRVIRWQSKEKKTSQKEDGRQTVMYGPERRQRNRCNQ